MATFRPKWFLISPSLTASGACSLIIWKSDLIPMVLLNERWRCKRWCVRSQSSCGVSKAAVEARSQWVKAGRGSDVCVADATRNHPPTTFSPTWLGAEPQHCSEGLRAMDACMHAYMRAPSRRASDRDAERVLACKRFSGCVLRAASFWTSGIRRRWRREPELPLQGAAVHGSVV